MRILDWFLPEPAADAATSRRGRILLGSALGLVLIVAVGLGVRLAISELHPAVVALDLGCILVFLAVPWLLRASGSLDAAGSAAILGLLLLVVAPGFIVGGLDVPVLMAAPVLPVAATYLLGFRAGMLQVVLLLIAIWLLVILPHVGLSPPALGLLGEEVSQARGLILSLTVAFAALLAWLSEHQRVDAESRFRRSEELYRRTFEQSKDIVVLTSREGRLIDINQAGLDFYGFDSNERVVGRDMARGYVDPEQRRALLERLEAAGFVQSYKTQHVTSSGEVRHLEGSTSIIRGEDGKIEMLLAILRDVTERQRAEEEREAMLHELSAKNADLERFSYAVSHDLKAPLITLRGFLGLLRKDALAGRAERVEESYATLDRVARRMAEMIDGLLGLSRIQRKKVERGAVSLVEAAREATELLGGRIRDTGAVVELAEDLPRARADPALLRLIFQNLIDNAVKFSDGASPPRIEITAERAAEHVTCSVRDNGVGIPAEELETIFELFHRGQADTEGTGIGLASVRRAVETLDGRIWAESEGEGHGTTVRFTVPVADPEG